MVSTGTWSPCFSFLRAAAHSLVSGRLTVRPRAVSICAFCFLPQPLPGPPLPLLTQPQAPTHPHTFSSASLWSSWLANSTDVTHILHTELNNLWLTNIEMLKISNGEIKWPLVRFTWVTEWLILRVLIWAALTLLKYYDMIIYNIMATEKYIMRFFRLMFHRK